MPPSDIDHFALRVDNWVTGLLKKGVSDFNDMLLALPGVYPSVLVDSLRRTAEKGTLSRASLSRILRQTSCKKTRATQLKPHHSISLPVPHPLDFEWRFTEVASRHILVRCSQLVNDNELITLLGTPSLFRTAIEENYSGKVVFVGDNTIVSESLSQAVTDHEVLCCNVINDTQPPLLSSVVVLDPPWYEDYIYPFLWMATQCCKINGHILISLPAEGTRPGTKHEWAVILKWAKTLGLSFIRREVSALPYSSPFFEQNALKAEGICNYPREWRRGDLVIFKRICRKETARPQIPQRDEWAEICLEDVRVRVRHSSESQFTDPSLITVTQGDILSSVSRKDPRRALADVWTSGNRIFGCKGRSIFVKLLQALSNKQLPNKVVTQHIGRSLKGNELKLIERTIAQISNIIKTEKREYITYRRTVNVLHYNSLNHAQLLPLLKGDPFWENYLTQQDAKENSAHRLHLAIFIEPYLQYILDGIKTIESRFSVSRCAPYKAIERGDIVLLKKSSGPIVGICRAADVWFYQLDKKSWQSIKKGFAIALCAQDPDFWKSRKHAAFATLIRIDRITAIQPINIIKNDRRGWVVLGGKTQKELFPS